MDLSFFLFFFREERFHIKPVICHSLKALPSQLTIQTVFIIAGPLTRGHIVPPDSLKRQMSNAMSGHCFLPLWFW